MEGEEVFEEQVRTLADNLHKLHLASSYDEARRRAEEILRNTQGEGRSVEKISDVVQKAADTIDKAEIIEKQQEN